MTVDGRMRAGPRIPLSVRVLGIAITVAALCAALSVAALALWIAALLVPIAIVAVAVAWVAFKVRRWRSGPTAGPIVVRWPPR